MENVNEAAPEAVEVVQEQVAPESDPTSTRDAISGEVDEQSDEPLSVEENAAVKEELRQMFNLKIDGEEKEFDLGNEEHTSELRRLAQLGGAGHKRMQEAAEQRKMVESILSELKTDPRNVMNDLGIDVREFAEAIISEEIENMKKSPEQLAQEEKDRKYAKLEAQLAQQEQERAIAEQIRFEEQAASDLDREIVDALATHKDLPKSPYTIKRIADFMLAEMERGNFNVKVSQILPHIKDSIKGELHGFFSGLDEDTLENYLGNGVSERLRKRRLAKAKAPVTAPVSVPKTGAGVSKRAAPAVKEPIDMKEFLFGKKSRK